MDQSVTLIPRSSPAPVLKSVKTDAASGHKLEPCREDLGTRLTGQYSVIKIEIPVHILCAAGNCPYSFCRVVFLCARSHKWQTLQMILGLLQVATTGTVVCVRTVHLLLWIYHNIHKKSNLNTSAVNSRTCFVTMLIYSYSMLFATELYYSA